MGMIAHHVIIVTGFDREQIEFAHAKAKELGCSTTEILESPINAYLTFFIGPDGSKEGWEESNKGDKQRNAFWTWVKAGENFLDVVEVWYGEIDGEFKITRGMT